MDERRVTALCRAWEQLTPAQKDFAAGVMTADAPEAFAAAVLMAQAGARDG